ncbi:MAG: sigma-54 dependent transcriptional regulator, partial [Deltaproteobacteria bacterium]|nr:sigma-54 dependent transcriptional regulator [Deltaproteobacteria bacterium]
MTGPDVRQARVLVADDEQPIRFVLKNALEAEGFTVDLAEDGDAALVRLQSGAYPVAFVDIKMPGMTGLDILNRLAELGCDTSVIIITAQATMQNAIEAMSRGAYEYLTKPFNLDDVVQKTRKALEARAMAKAARMVDRRGGEPLPEERTIIGQSPAMQEICKTIGRLSKTDVTVLIQGESGTGKELVARALHRASRRHAFPFVTVNASAIPATLMESELFGFERGAFTGAHQRHAGKFEQAEGGTLFLDEIGEMTGDLQAKLLRVLQEGEYDSLGSTRPRKANVRIVAATNLRLDQAVQEKRFRSDLFYRLNVVSLEILPLRDRREDIPILADYFVRRFQGETGLGEKFLSEDAMAVLKQWSWPGNVRELENVLKRAMALSSQDVLL